jgi:hypothetical protein
LSTKKPTTRARNTTKVFTTPWIRVSVTMSPLATWATSWPEHGFDFVAVHVRQQAGRDRDQRRILEGAGGEGVRLAVVHRHFRHADAGRSASGARC